MKPATPVPTAAHPRRLVWGLAALALGGWALQSWLSANPPAARPGVVLAARAPADASLVSPFGAGPAVVASAATVLPAPEPAAVSAPVTPAAVSQPVALPPPTLDAAERAEARALLAEAGALDAHTARELDALLYQDSWQRFLVLREAGEQGDELQALAAELRAGLGAREAARDLPPALLLQVRAALQPNGAAASPFAAQR